MLNIYHAEKKAIHYLQAKFNSKSIKVASARFNAPGQALVIGELEDNEGLVNNFEVTVGTLSETIGSWRLTPR